MAQRIRSSNFTSHEKKILYQLMEQYGTIIEDKKTDNMTIKKKEDTWVQLHLHLADAFIQNDLQYSKAIYIFFNQYVCSLGIEPTTFCAVNAMLYH